jgi:hypothetical protein
MYRQTPIRRQFSKVQIHIHHPALTTIACKSDFYDPMRVKILTFDVLIRLGGFNCRIIVFDAAATHISEEC